MDVYTTFLSGDALIDRMAQIFLQQLTFRNFDIQSDPVSDERCSVCQNLYGL